jgi:hypothetical protein
VNEDLLSDLTETMAEQGFSEVSDMRALPDATLLLKRQTWNTNRAIVVVSPTETPSDIDEYLRQLRKRVAFRCGFFPFFWGIGIQVIVVAPGLSQGGIDPGKYVARVDNQWAIIQSVFLADPTAGTYRAGRTWGQFVTGRFQDAISTVLSRHFRSTTDKHEA